MPQQEKIFTDPYKALGVARTASIDEVRKAWLDKVKQLHPDTSQQRSENSPNDYGGELLKLLNSAYNHIKKSPDKPFEHKFKVSVQESTNEDNETRREFIESVIEFILSNKTKKFGISIDELINISGITIIELFESVKFKRTIYKIIVEDALKTKKSKQAIEFIELLKSSNLMDTQIFAEVVTEALLNLKKKFN